MKKLFMEDLFTPFWSQLPEEQRSSLVQFASEEVTLEKDEENLIVEEIKEKIEEEVKEEVKKVLKERLPSLMPLLICLDPTYDGDDSYLEKMFGAIHVPREKWQTCRENYQEKIRELRPQVVMTFGAQMHELMSGKMERLALIHGREYLHTFAEDLQVWCIPMFHLNNIQANPHLKKATWDDLQAFRQFLTKLNVC
jgi:hypothetical protein